MWREVLRRYGSTQAHDTEREHEDAREQLGWPGKRAASAELELPETDLRTYDLGQLRDALASLDGNGAELPESSARFARLLGADLSRVTIHTSGRASEAAARLGAQAFTHGSHIAFAPGVYRPDSARSRYILAHELVHVVQNQRAGAAMKLAARLGVGPSNSAIEREAEAGAAALIRGQSFQVASRAGLPGISMFSSGEHALDDAELEAQVAEELERRADVSVRSRYARSLANVDLLRDHVQKGAPDAEAERQAPPSAPAAPGAAATATTEAASAPAPAKPAAPEAAKPATGKPAAAPKAAPARPLEPLLDPRTKLEVAIEPTAAVSLEMWPSQLAAMERAKQVLLDTRRKAEEHHEAVAPKGDKEPVEVHQLDAKLVELKAKRLPPEASAPSSNADELPAVAPTQAAPGKPQVDPAATKEHAKSVRALASIEDTEQRLDRAISRGRRYLAQVLPKVRAEVRARNAERKKGNSDVDPKVAGKLAELATSRVHAAAHLEHVAPQLQASFDAQVPGVGDLNVGNGQLELSAQLPGLGDAHVAVGPRGVDASAQLPGLGNAHVATGNGRFDASASAPGLGNAHVATGPGGVDVTANSPQLGDLHVAKRNGRLDASASVPGLGNAHVATGPGGVEGLDASVALPGLGNVHLGGGQTGFDASVALPGLGNAHVTAGPGGVDTSTSVALPGLGNVHLGGGQAGFDASVALPGLGKVHVTAGPGGVDASASVPQLGDLQIAERNGRFDASAQLPGLGNAHLATGPGGLEGLDAAVAIPGLGDLHLGGGQRGFDASVASPELGNAQLSAGPAGVDASATMPGVGDLHAGARSGAPGSLELSASSPGGASGHATATPTTAGLDAHVPQLGDLQLDAGLSSLGLGIELPGLGRVRAGAGRDGVSVDASAPGLGSIHLDPTTARVVLGGELTRDGHDPALGRRLDRVHAFDELNQRVVHGGAPANENAGAEDAAHRVPSTRQLVEQKKDAEPVVDQIAPSHGVAPGETIGGKLEQLLGPAFGPAVHGMIAPGMAKLELHTGHGPARVHGELEFDARPALDHLGHEAPHVAKFARDAQLKTLDPRLHVEVAPGDDAHAATAKALGQPVPSYDAKLDHAPPAPHPGGGKHAGGGHAGGGHAAAPKPPPLPPAPVSKGQAQVNAYIAKARKDRDAAKAKVQGEQLAKCAQVTVDANAIAIATKAANDQKLAQLRKDAEADKAKAAKEAAERKQQEGPVTLESLKAKLEATATADKEKLKTTFERKQTELELRLDTQKETLKKETDKQVENVKKEQEAKQKAAQAKWDGEKKNLEASNVKLMEQLRAQVVEDQKRLEADKQKLWDAANKRMAEIDKKAKDDSAKVLAKGEADAKKLTDKAATDGKAQIAMASARAATIRANAAASAAKSEDSATSIKAKGELEAIAEEAKGKRLADDLEIKAELAAKKTRDDAKKESDRVLDAGKKAHEDANTSATKQVQAIADKITGLKDLGDQKIKQAGEDLKKKLDDGQKKLAESLKGTDEKIAKIKADGEAKLKKLGEDTGKDLQKDYDTEVKAIDQRLEIARKQLAAGSEKNLKALEKMVDQACVAIDKSVTTAEKKFDARIADAEKKASALVISQLQKVKAEADKALKEIDKSFEQAMKAVDDAIEATYRTLEETAQGKMLEVEVHIATLLADTGDDTRLKAVKEQLAQYIKTGQKIPQGYGETANPAPPSDAAKKPDEKPQPGKDAKKDEKAAEAVRPDADAERQKELLDPKNLSPEGIEAKVAEQLKKGQQQTNLAGAEQAKASVDAAYKAATTALETSFQTRVKGLDDLQSNDPEVARKAGEEVKKYRDDRELGEQRAADMVKAAEKEGWFGKDPDKKAILRSMEGMDEQQIEMLRKALKARTPSVDLDALLKDNLSGDDMKEAKIRLQGDPIMADIQTLELRGGHHLTANERMLAGAWVDPVLLLTGRDPANANIGADDERIKEILARYKDDPDKMKQFAEAYEKATGKQLSTYLQATGNTELTKEMGIPVREPDTGTPEEIKTKAKEEQDRLIAEAAKNGKPIDQAKLSKSTADLLSALEGVHFDGKRGDMVRDALQGKSPEEIAALKAMYKAQTGHDLDTLIEQRVQGTALPEVKAMMRGDNTEVAVQRILGAEGASLLPGTVDDKKLQDVLRELKDPAERRAVLEAYKKRTGQDLSETIASHMTGNDRKLAMALYEGDELKARMVEMDEATNGGWMNSMHDAVAERTGLDTQKYTRAFANYALFGWQGAALSAVTGDPTVTIGGYEIGNGSIHKVDSDKILDLLEQTPNPADRERLKALYKQQTGRDMDADMAQKLGGVTGDSSKLDAYHALQEGRTADAAAARMETALDGINDTKAFHKQLEGKPEWQRKQIIEAYNKRHPEDPNAFVNLVNGQLGGLDVEKANHLAFDKDDAKTGAVKLPDEFVLRYAQDSVWTKTAKFIDKHTEFADKYPVVYLVPFLGQGLAEAKAASYFMRGWGVDDQAIKDVLKDKSLEEIEELKKQYPQLEQDLEYVLSGRSAYEVELMLKEGAPQTPQAKAKRALDLYDFDRGAKGEWIPGFHHVSNAIVDVFDPSGKLMDQQAAQLRELQANPNLSAAQKQELENALAMMDASTSHFLEAREAVTEAMATAVGAVVGAAVTILTGGVAGAVIAAIATGMSTIAVKTAMLGQAYGRNELGVDLAMMAVQAATGGLGVAAGAQSFLGQVLTGAISNGVSQFVSTAITSKDAHDLLSLLTQASKAGLVGMLSGGAGAAATAALGKAMEKLSAKAFGEGASVFGKAVKGFVTGGGSAVASLLAEAAVNPEVLSGDWDAVFAQLGRSFLEGAVQNALSEGAEAHRDNVRSKIPGTPEHAAAKARAEEHAAAQQKQQEQAQAALAEATAAAKAKQADGGSLSEQQQAFAEAMAKHAKDAPPLPKPDAQPATPEAVEQKQAQAKTEELPKPDEVKAKTQEHVQNGKLDEPATKTAEQPATKDQPATKTAELPATKTAEQPATKDQPATKTAELPAVGDGAAKPKDLPATKDQPASKTAELPAVGDGAAKPKDLPFAKPGDDAHAGKTPGDDAHAGKTPGDDAHAGKKPGDDDAHAGRTPGDDDAHAAAKKAADKAPDAAAAPRVTAKGLADHTTIESFADRMKSIEQGWASLPPDQRAQRISAVLNAELAAQGLPGMKVHAVDFADGRNGEFDAGGWSVKLNTSLLAPDGHVDPEVMASLVNITIHEARHAEQYYLVARLMTEAGVAPDYIHARTGIDPDIARRARLEPAPLTPEQSTAARSYWDSIFGDSSGRRQGVLDEQSRAYPEAMRAEAEWKAIKDDPSRSLEEKQLAHARYAETSAAAWRAYRDYVALPEEADAHHVGNTTEAKYKTAKAKATPLDAAEATPAHAAAPAAGAAAPAAAAFPEPRPLLKRPEHNPLADAHNAAVDREVALLAKQHPGASEEALLEAARAKVVADELEPGVEHEAPKPKSDELPDLRKAAELHEKAVAEEAARIMAADPEHKLSIDEVMKQARAKVVDDEIATHKDLNEQRQDKLDARVKTAFDAAPPILEQFVSKQAADAVKLLGELITKGKVSSKSVGDVALNAAFKAIEIGFTAKFGAEAGAVVKEALKPIKEALKTGKPVQLEELGRLIKASVAVAGSPRDVAFLRGLAHEGMQPSAGTADHLERYAQVIAEANALQASNKALSREDALRLATEHTNDTAAFGEAMAEAARREAPDDGVVIDLSQTKLPPEPETHVLDPEAAARAEARAAELQQVQLAYETAATLARLADAGGEVTSGPTASDRLAVAEQNKREVETERAATAARDKAVASKFTELMKARMELDLADTAVNHSTTPGKQPDPALARTQEQAEARFARLKAELDELQNTPIEQFAPRPERKQIATGEPEAGGGPGRGGPDEPSTKLRVATEPPASEAHALEAEAQAIAEAEDADQPLRRRPPVAAPHFDPPVAAISAGPTKAGSADALAREAKRQADEDRKNGITPERRKLFEEIGALAALATTHADFEAIRQLEEEHGRPASERHSPYDEAATLQVIARTESYGLHEDGTPVTKAEHEAAVAALQKDYIDPLIQAKAKGISGGKVTRDDFLGRAATDAELAGARAQSAAERAMSLDEQAASITTGTARSERDLLLAVQNGELPRFSARVGPSSNFDYGTFANPKRPFSFAAEPTDLRGVSPAEAMQKVGWTREWIEPNIGKEIVIVVLDIEVALANVTGGTSTIAKGSMEWPELKTKALSDPKFLHDAEVLGIPQTDLPGLFDTASKTPVKGAPTGGDPAQLAKLRGLIDRSYGANELYTGMGATMNESGQLGAREVMIEPNGTGLALTPDNHRKVSLGVMTQAQFDALFPPAGSTGGTSGP